MKLFVIDTETSGLDPLRHQVVEIAGAIYDTVEKSTLWQFSSLVPNTSNVAMDPHAAVVHGISSSLLKAADGVADPFEVIGIHADLTDAYVAHNAPFDRSMIGNRLPEKRWIDSSRDIKFPRAGKSRRLAHLAVDHGIIVTAAHRALADVLTVVELLKVVPDLDNQINGVIETPIQPAGPTGVYRAMVSYDQRDLAKSAKFKWCNDKGTRGEWRKILPQVSNLGEIIRLPEFPFSIVRVE